MIARQDGKLLAIISRYRAKLSSHIKKIFLFLPNSLPACLDYLPRTPDHLSALCNCPNVHQLTPHPLTGVVKDIQTNKMWHHLKAIPQTESQTHLCFNSNKNHYLTLVCIGNFLKYILAKVLKIVRCEF
jgi:hypothetical protein